MPHIVLTEEQARILAEANGAVDVRGPDGQPVASLSLFTPQDIEALERHRRNRDKREPGIPMTRVFAHLRRLEEIRQAEGMDEAKMKELLRRMRAGEEV
jgi:hypothetical protein